MRELVSRHHICVILHRIGPRKYVERRQQPHSQPIKPLLTVCIDMIWHKHPHPAATYHPLLFALPSSALAFELAFLVSCFLLFSLAHRSG